MIEIITLLAPWATLFTVQTSVTLLLERITDLFKKFFFKT